MNTTENRTGTYADVRQYLDELDRRGLLVRVDRKTNKDTEIMPLVRWQFRGLTQDQRKGWLFSTVTDSRGRDFDGSVTVSIVGASPTVYAAAIGAHSPGRIAAKWAQAQDAPVKPRVVQRFPIRTGPQQLTPRPTAAAIAPRCGDALVADRAGWATRRGLR
jgi:hypothetical protein